jgi:hypothetical protein
VNHLKKHLSFANVLSCVALFVALSGAAYAATTLGSKAVKTRNLANGAVTTKKLRNGAVTAAKLRKEAVIATKIALGNVGSTQLADGGVRSGDLGGGVVTSSKLKDGAVTSAKIAGEAVGTGQIKEGAVTGGKLAPALLAQLVKNVSYATSTSPSDNTTDPKTVTAECLPGPSRKQVVGGGARVLGSTKVALVESAPKLDPAGNRVGWSAAAKALEAPLAENWAIEVYAICAEF